MPKQTLVFTHDQIDMQKQALAANITAWSRN